MSTKNRVLYLFAGGGFFIVSGLLTVVAVKHLETNPDDIILGIPTNVWVGILGSISASGIFFTVSEGLRWKFDRETFSNYERLQFYENIVGIMHYFNQKGGDDARKHYKKAISKARHRVWAFGISNGEFIDAHLARLIEKKRLTPLLDVCICFVDPDTKITNEELRNL